jgi:hypothetical protein
LPILNIHVSSSEHHSQEINLACKKPSGRIKKVLCCVIFARKIPLPPTGDTLLKTPFIIIARGGAGQMPRAMSVRG